MPCCFGECTDNVVLFYKQVLLHIVVRIAQDDTTLEQDQVDTLYTKLIKKD